MSMCQVMICDWCGREFDPTVCITSGDVVRPMYAEVGYRPETVPTEHICVTCVESSKAWMQSRHRNTRGMHQRVDIAIHNLVSEVCDKLGVPVPEHRHVRDKIRERIVDIVEREGER